MPTVEFCMARDPETAVRCHLPTGHDGLFHEGNNVGGHGPRRMVRWLVDDAADLLGAEAEAFLGGRRK